ncbi:hypothetical protein LC082_01130 [Microbacterium esteraromaticum]|uniref:hypothetical protein n=1 Tax=Microbacterium esteraromaticum TaxID=57043 RepID=UPI001CD688AF|nr:hypothetical protein [Microbacterium esteraromaticum]MCA1305496.1 hypothetical protein [Microbacterium esteraromaticum]
MVTVLHTVVPSDDKTNPFVNLMVDSLPPTVDSSFFSWRRALAGRDEVIHFQWPEKLVHGRGALRSLLKRIAFRLVLLRAAQRRNAIVLTLHNLESHEQMNRGSSRALGALMRQVDHVVLLNGSHDPGVPNAVTTVIPHGHYRTTIRERSFPTENPQSLLFFGLIRAYKNVPQVVRAFQQSGLRGRGVTLDIVGRAWDQTQHDDVTRAVEQGADGISVHLEAVTDAELHERILASGLIVLPYRRLYNSGVVLLALSLDRPVLVPECPAAAELQREFGREWVMTFDGDLDGPALAAAYTEYSEAAQYRRPLEMEERSWEHLGRRYRDVYADAVAHRTGTAPAASPRVGT